MKEYLFNDCGVCMNPDKFGEIKCDTGLLPTQYISVAKKPNGRWTYGLNYAYDHNGAGLFAASLKKEDYPTQRDAVIAGCRHINDKIAEQEKTHSETYTAYLDDEEEPIVDTCKNMRKCVELAYNQVTQLTLF